MSIRTAHASEFETLTQVWEASVRATHGFLSETDLQALRPRIRDEWLPALQVIVFAGHDDQLLGFAAIHEEKLEMLFMDPAWRGQGIGKALLAHALSKMAVSRVDVNEQNEQALGFYLHAGFDVIGRSPVDAQGKPYPILHMQLACASRQAHGGLR